MYANDPTLWFCLVDAYFALYATPGERKLNLLYCTLPPSLALLYFIIHPCVDVNYIYVKTETLRRNTESEVARFRIFIHEELLSNRSPSQFLRRLRELCGSDTEDESLLRNLFLSCLPLEAQLIFAPVVEDSFLDQIATMVDRAVDFTHHTTTAAMTAAVPVVALRVTTQRLLLRS